MTRGPVLSPPYILSSWLRQVLQWNEALAFRGQNRSKDCPGEPKEKPVGWLARPGQSDPGDEQELPGPANTSSPVSGQELTLGTELFAWKSGSHGDGSQPVDLSLRCCPLKMDVWGHLYPFQEFPASSDLLVKSWESWSSLVCFILCITRSYLEGTSPNEAKQQTILNTLKQSLPL